MNISPKTRKGFLYIESSDFKTAEEFFEEAIKENSEDACAYLGKLLVDLKVKTLQELKNISVPLKNNVNFNFALQFGDKATRAKLNEIENEILNRIDDEKSISCEKIYNQAIGILNSIKTKSDVLKAIELLNTLDLHYKDVAEKIEFCNDKLTEFDYYSKVNILEEVCSMPKCKAKCVGLEK